MTTNTNLPSHLPTSYNNSNHTPKEEGTLRSCQAPIWLLWISYLPLWDSVAASISILSRIPLRRLMSKSGALLDNFVMTGFQ